MPDERDSENFQFTDYLKYAPEEMYIDYPTKVFGGKKSKKMKTEKKKKSELIQEFDSTISSLNQKSLKDSSSAYFVLEFHSSPMSRKYQVLIEEMNINLVTFLDKAQKKGLVESGYDIKEKNFSYRVRDIIKKVRPLLSSEKLETSLIGTSKSENVIINTIPNVSVEKITSHLRKVVDYLNRNGAEIYTSLLDKDNKRGSVIAKTSGNLLERLVDDSTIVLSAYKVPDLILSVIKERRRRKSLPSTLTLSSEPFDKTSSEIYDIIQIDSGTKILQEFQQKVVSFPALSFFKDGEDINNHRTPITSRLLFGEIDNNFSSPFRVYSYKAAEENNPKSVPTTLYEALKNVRTLRYLQVL